MPETALLPRSGLITSEREPIPLTGVAIDADISNLSARVMVTQRFVNRETKPIEAVYLFPLDEGAAVCGFEALVDGTLVIGEVKEREDAFRLYDEAMESGHGAMLLDEERPDVFQASVGNLLPGAEAVLRITYVTELGVTGGDLRFTIPTTVSPRYAPTEDHAGVGRPDAQALNPPRLWSVPYGLDLKVALSMTGEIVRIDSPSHPISIGLNGGNATVTLSQRDTALDRDFVLNVHAPSFEAPQSRVEQGEDGAHAIAISFVPRLPEKVSPAEVIFLVDRSGSMAGTSIAEVRTALEVCLRSMVSGCWFNIIGFGSTTDRLFETSREYNDATLSEASAYVSTLQADLGGTELLPALTAALEQPALGSLTRQIVLLTDGQVTNTDAVLRLAAKHDSDARIFTFGIGAGASHHLVKGLARAGLGIAEFIYPGERIEPKVIRQFGHLLSPALTNVRVEWDGLDVVSAPSRIPPVFANGRLILYGFLRGTKAASDSTIVRLTANNGSEPVAFEVGVNSSQAVSGRTIATLAGRARIRELEESGDWTPARGSRQHDRKQNQVIREIVELSMRYGLISRETSYVAIERRDTPVAGDVQLRRVPIALTYGWGGVRVRDMRGVDRGTGPEPFQRMFGEMRLGDMASAGSSLTDAAPRLSVGTFLGFSRARQLLRGKGPTDVPAYVPLIRLQRADGSWELDETFAAAIKRDVHDLEAALGADAGSAEVRRVWATALAIAWLQLHESSAREQWELVEMKAKRWLARMAPDLPGGTPWIAKTEEYLRATR